MAACFGGGGGVGSGGERFERHERGVGLVESELEAGAREDGFAAIRGLRVIQGGGQGLHGLRQASAGGQGLGFPEIGFRIFRGERLPQQGEGLGRVAAADPGLGQAHGDARFLGAGQTRILQQLVEADRGNVP